MDRRHFHLKVIAATGTLAAGVYVSAVQPPRPTFLFEKTGKVVLSRGPSGSFDSTHAKYPCVLKVNDLWMMWYSGRTDDGFTGSIGLATSGDGLRWSKANEGGPVFTHGGPRTTDETKADHPAVVHFDGRFHMWYTAGPRDSQYRICYATSDDGYRWGRQNDGRPVLGPGEKGKFDDRIVLHPAVVRDTNGLLHMWYNGVGPQKEFHVGHATSSDGIEWQRQNGGDPVLSGGTIGRRHEIYVYNVMVLFEDGVYRMWYSSALNLTAQGRYAQHGSAIVYAESRDGTKWTCDDAITLLSGDEGEQDAYACFAPYVVRRDDGLWMYYSMGSAYQRYQTGLAKCRRQ
ncbi:MAG: hypothetical protein VB878_17045 [Pirellulaceae bacterium]